MFLSFAAYNIKFLRIHKTEADIGLLLWLKITPTYYNMKDNNVRRKNTPPSIQDELKKITV